MPIAPTTKIAPIKISALSSRRRKQHSGQSQNARQHIRNRDGLLLRKTHVDEPVVDMPAVRLHGVLPLCNAAQEGKADIKNRHAENEKRHGKGDDRVHLKEAGHGKRRENVAQKCCARISHEDFCWVHVVRNEAEARAKERRKHDSDIRLGDHERDDRDRGRRNRGHTDR